MERIEITVVTSSCLCSNFIGGYANSGVFPRTYSYYYLVTDENDKVYTISTSHRIENNMRIRASVKGERDYKGVHQIALTRVSIL